MAGFSYATICYLLQPVFLVDLQISCGDPAPSLCQCVQALVGLFPGSCFSNEGYQHFGTAYWQRA